MQIHVTDPRTFRPVATYVALIALAHHASPSEFRFRTEKYEFVDDIPAFDLLTGSAEARERILAGDDAARDRRRRLRGRRGGARRRRRGPRRRRLGRHRVGRGRQRVRYSVSSFGNELGETDLRSDWRNSFSFAGSSGAATQTLAVS